jgi:transcriptional regulator with PAS, ATPase and Fis domain
MGGNRQPDRRETVILDSINHLQGGDIAGVSPGVLARLMEHGYPGKVREREKVIEVKALGIETPDSDGRGRRR